MSRAAKATNTQSRVTPIVALTDALDSDVFDMSTLRVCIPGTSDAPLVALAIRFEFASQATSLAMKLLSREQRAAANIAAARARSRDSWKCARSWDYSWHSPTPRHAPSRTRLTESNRAMAIARDKLRREQRLQKAVRADRE